MARAALAIDGRVGMSAIAPRRPARRFWPQAILFLACAILVNAVFGDRGLTESMRARRQYAAAQQELAKLKRENTALRERMRRLRSDPAAIEAIARGELGLLRQGEVLVVVKDER